MQKHTTKRTPKQSAKTTRGTKTHKPAAAKSAREIDYALTSQKNLVSKKAPPAVEIRLKRFLSGRTLKEFRKAHGYSAHALAVELGVSRSYIKSIEGGSLAASQKLIARFNELRDRIGEGSAPESETPRTVTSKYHLPQTFEILAKPTRCKVCKKFFVGHTPAQKYCSPTCAKLARKRKTKRAKARRNKTS